MDAAAVMGLAVRENAEMADGFFKNDKEHQLKLIHYIRKYQPEMIIANALEDRHPDHGRAGRLIADASFLAGLRKVPTLLDGKEQEAWRPKRVFHMIQDRLLEPSFLVDISDCFEQKLESIRCYKSQFHDPTSNEPATYISSQDFLKQIEYRDAIMGKKIGTKYAEGFICENLPGLRDLDDLLLPKMA
jgi:bacillithiol biosynthesis deacetylase BshB1